ncbi:uncharacterized protein SPSK_03686 [Sporothrix schenckii 1099-18]|uniref:Bicarbonate transporter-like transmembrane domain-containing protein n=1 Tax=Sporothrix schenckii 1099-18 TaxID=1397361 RepID=A0A0F2M0Q3_SPOSC|nr:uncharacterized protein SPSK_03686 [Sporothrix schenckii 1099-18]KJR82654.1 hypothetical protein SPSK_03686 [Sporothrix schenckii 1099-18]
MDQRPPSNNGLPVHRVQFSPTQHRNPGPGRHWIRRRLPRWLRSSRRLIDGVVVTEERGMPPTDLTRRQASRAFATVFRRGGVLQPFRLIGQDLRNLRSRYVSDWTVFNQLVFASAVYVFFTNILPGITFASDLDVLTGQSWGTIEVVFSTGLCGLIFSL